MVYERGPQGMIHIPSYRDGCYRGRLTDCCLLCLCRLAVASSTAPVRYRIRDARREDDHELVGERLTVPDVVPSSDRTGLDYQEGTIDAVYCLASDDPDFLTVTTDDNEQIHIDLSPAEQEEPVEA